jgi:hypothetical protein
VFYWWLLIAVMVLIVAGMVARRPKLFWPMLVIGSITTSGIIVAREFTFLDEFFLGAVIFGGFMAISLGAVTLYKPHEDKWDYIHRLMFFLMIIYMIIECARGMILLESLRKIRWIIYFSMLGVLSFMLSKKAFSVPNRRKLSLIISISTLIYFVTYTVYGLFSQWFRKVDIWSLETVEWASTAYAIFPVIIAVPACLFLIKEKKRIYRWIGLTTLISALITAFFYDSRVAWLVIIAFLIISLPFLGFRKSIIFFLIFFIILNLTIYYFWPEWRTFSQFKGELLRSTLSILNVYKPENPDKVRRILIQVILAKDFWGDWKSLLFGYGFRAHGYIVGPYIADKFSNDLDPLLEGLKKQGSSEAFTALLVDSGLFGMLLLAINFLLTARNVLKRTKFNLKDYRIVLLLVLPLMFSWLFVINLVDIVLFYLIIMPNGLLIQLSRFESAEVA